MLTCVALPLQEVLNPVAVKQILEPQLQIETRLVHELEPSARKQLARELPIGELTQVIATVRTFEPIGQCDQSFLVRGCDDCHPTGPKHTPPLLQGFTHVGDVLDHLASKQRVELLVPKRNRRRIEDAHCW